jgi:hypothetical protein
MRRATQRHWNSFNTWLNNGRDKSKPLTVPSATYHCIMLA